jgi:hypothetical protein
MHSIKQRKGHMLARYKEAEEGMITRETHLVGPYAITLVLSIKKNMGWTHTDRSLIPLSRYLQPSKYHWMDLNPIVSWSVKNTIM